jgi:hypothetical protein
MPVIIVDDQDDPSEIVVADDESVRLLGVPELNGISIRSYATSPRAGLTDWPVVSWAFRQDC